MKPKKETILSFIIDRMLFKEQWPGKTWVVQAFRLWLKYLQCPMFGSHDGLLQKNIGVCEFHVVVFSFFRNDPFPQDILPTNVPSLLNELPESDRRQLLDEYV